MYFLLDLAVHTALDILYLIPYLYATYLILEYIEHHTRSKIRRAVQSAKRFGPLVGAVLAPVSGCGLSVASANFYATRLISLGTLIAVFLATSDEMLPLMISSGISGTVIFQIILFKVCFATLAGLLIDLYTHKKKQPLGIKELCENHQCGCHHHGIFKSALIHTVQLVIFIFLISYLLNILLALTGTSFLKELITQNPIGSIFMASLVGLIPNCAISVGLTQLYIENILPISALIGGLSANAGVGLIVFWKMSRSLKETFKIAFLLFACAVISGNTALLIFG
mgnify:CR=1 FL=1